MRKLEQISLAIAAFSSIALLLPVFADQTPASVVNLDTPAAASQCKAHAHGHGGPIQSIKSLPSLSQDQSKQLDGILQTFKQDVKPLKQEAKALKDKLAEGGDNQDKAQSRLQEIRTQVHAMKRQMVQKAIALLTPEQKQQLKAMHPGRRGTRNGAANSDNLQAPSGMSTPSNAPESGSQDSSSMQGPSGQQSSSQGFDSNKPDA